MQVDAALAEGVVHGRGHLGVERGHHLGQGLDERDLQALVDEVLGDLDADEAAADDDGGLLTANGGDHGVGVLDVAQGEGALDAGDRWAHRARAGGEDHLVIRQFLGRPGGEVAHVDDLVLAVDARGLGGDAHVEAEAGGQ